MYNSAQSILEHFHYCPQKETLYSLTVTPYFLLPLVEDRPISLTVNLFIYLFYFIF